MSGEALITELRCLQVLVMHPPGAERDELTQHLRRIGCNVRVQWPVPQEVPEGTGVVCCLIDGESKHIVPWCRRRPPVPVIAIVHYESPTVIRAVLESGATGFIGKPIRPFGILTSLVMSRARHRYETTQERKVEKLKDALRTRRVLDRAIKILSEVKDVSEEEAYALIRQQSMAKRVSMASIGESIINASDLLRSSVTATPVGGADPKLDFRGGEVRRLRQRSH
jgi:two-component system, response regulator PdtaR